MFKAKTEMFDYAQENPFVVLNGDDDKLINVKEVKGSKPVFFGVETKQNVSIDEYEQIGVMGTKAVINYFDHKFETVIPIPGYHMLYNAMAATCIGVHFGMSFDEIDKGIRKLKAIGGRNNMFEANRCV